MLENRDLMLSLSRAVRRPALAGLVALGSTLLYGQADYSPQEGEYSLTRGRLGDQTHPALSLRADGGYVVWQDYATDGEGLGISARRLNNSLSPVLANTFRVNETSVGDQSAPTVEMLANGDGVFAWQGGASGVEDIFVRFVGANGVLRSSEIRVNDHTAGSQTDPDLTVLADGNVIVVWTSLGQDGSMQGVYAQRLSPTGEILGLGNGTSALQVNTTTAFNQRTPTVAGLSDGDFVVVWVSEHQRYENSVDLLARRFNADGTPETGEVLVTVSTTLSANPAIASTPQGRFVIAWSSQSLDALRDGWDVVACVYELNGTPVTDPVRLNDFTLGHQYAPMLAANAEGVMAAWTAEYQDGSREGVYGRFLSTAGATGLIGESFRVNTWTASRQLYPAVASDGGERFLIGWSSYVGGDASFEVLAQRYAATEVLLRPDAPHLVTLDSYSMLVSWPELAGYDEPVKYHVYVDGNTVPVVTEAAWHKMENLVPASSHSVQLAYELASGQVSPASEAAEASTWGRDQNYDGFPDDWQRSVWGEDSEAWPGALTDGDGDGANVLAEFRAGTDPTDPESVLKVTLGVTPDGSLVRWPTIPGNLYQLQGSGDLSSWSDIEGLRFAAGEELSVVVPFAGGASYYRVIRIR